jgi:hypothetical protein
MIATAMSETAADRWRLVRGTNLKPEDRHVLLTLFLFQGNNAAAFCKQETLADEIGVSTRSIRTSLNRLNAAGIVRSEWKGRNGVGVRYYTIDFQNLKTVQRCEGRNPASYLEAPEGRKPASYLESEGRKPASTMVGSLLPQWSEAGFLQEDTLNIQEKIQKGASLPEIVFPENLDNEEFRCSWTEWVEFHREIKKKLAPSTVSKQLELLATWGSVKAIQAIQASIGNGWQGLFDPSQRTGKAAPVSAKSLNAWETLKQALRSIDKSKPYKDLLRQKLTPEIFKAAESVGFKALFGIDQFTESKLSTAFSIALTGDKNQ